MRAHSSSVPYVALVACLALIGCDAPTEATGVAHPPQSTLAAAPGVIAIASGGGVFDAGVPVGFSFSAVQRTPTGEGSGQLRFSTSLGGLPIEFHGRVTCVTSDLANRRAWIGGVITRNRSEHASFIGEIHQPGRDIWFRVVDYGQGAQAAQSDRTTFVGFEGSADIETSADYCEAQPWPDDDARTGPLLEGNISVLAPGHP